MQKVKVFGMNWLRSLNVLIILIAFFGLSYGQSSPCEFDEILDYNIQETSDFQFLMEQAEEQMQEMMNESPQAIMNGSVYTVPVVFHIIHLGANSASNIPESQVLQALDDLNSDFRDYQMTGTDVEIEFCLAQRDPQGGSQFNGAGENITGIQRVNGSVVEDYESLGIISQNSQSSNEIAVKALSNWPNTDYLNIWVVHNIPGGVIGFATLPVADDSVDGIVMEASATGTSDFSHVLSHEVGHFLNLFHTFRGSMNSTECPLNGDCHLDGDLLCDTRPHSALNDFNNWFPCDESQYMNCDASSYTYDVTENHMNYTDNDCRNEFTPDQVMRMRCALITLRSTLMNSVGCLPGCTDVMVDFTASVATIEEGMSITFTNQSLNANSYLWEVSSESFSTNDLTYSFEERGFYNVCLTASNPTCTNRKCIQIKVIGNDPCIFNDSECNLIRNGDFNESNFDYNNSFIFSAFGNDLNKICNWNEKWGSPDLYEKNNDAVVLLASGLTEGLVTERKIQFQKNVNYQIKFNYAVVSGSTNSNDIAILEIGLAPTSNEYLDSSIDMVIGQIIESDFFPGASPIFVDDIEEFHFKDEVINFIPTEDIEMHLYMYNNRVATNSTGNGILVNSVEINCNTTCTPIPDFTYDEDCPNEFIGVNTGDGDEYTWDFLCNGVTMTGQNVTINLPEGECDVCLTASCGFETFTTVCKTVTVPEITPECQPVCEDFTIYLQTCKQDLTEETTFIADFSLSVPDGTEACDGVDIVSGSNQFDASANVSIEDDPNDSSLDIVNISITFITPAGVDILNNSIAGLINLCDPTGNVICYNLICIATECANCLGEITAVANCTDTNPFDEEQTYQGSVTIDLPSIGGPYTECAPMSSESGYDQSVSITGSQATVNFTINTSTDGDFDASSLLCFYDEGFDIQFCQTLNIEIDPCPSPPDCITWANKVTEAGNCTVLDGQITYTVNMSDVDLFSAGYNVCSDGLGAYLNGSEEIILQGGSITNNGSDLSYSTIITMPCGFDSNEIYELIITACDINGKLVCFSFNIRFPECNEECEDRDENGTQGRSTTYRSNHKLIQMYPNPTRDEVFISVEKRNLRQHYAIIYDQLGRIIVETEISATTRLDLSDFDSGIHFIKVTDNAENLIGIEKLIILKE